MQNFVAYFPVQSPESVYRQGFCTGHLLHRTLTLPKVPNSDYQCFLITKHVETISFNEAPCSVFFCGLVGLGLMFVFMSPMLIFPQLFREGSINILIQIPR